MAENIIPFPRAPKEPIPPHEPTPGEQPPENVIFLKQPHGTTSSPPEKEGAQRDELGALPPSEKELVRKEIDEVRGIWENVQAALSGKRLKSTPDGWTYLSQHRDTIEISQVDPQDERDGSSSIRYAVGTPPNQTATTLQITSAYWPNGHLRRERVNLTQAKRTRAGWQEPFEATLGVILDEEGNNLGAWHPNAKRGLEIARQLGKTAIERLSQS